MIYKIKTVKHKSSKSNYFSGEMTQNKSMMDMSFDDNTKKIRAKYMSPRAHKKRLIFSEEKVKEFDD